MKNNRLIAIIGETSSGKDFASKYLCETHILRAVCSYTTRPIRANEVNGREHWFISNSEMRNLLKTEQIVAYTKIEDSASGKIGYEYCTTRKELERSDIYIIDPNGVHYFEDRNKDIKLIKLYIDASKEVRYNRALSREVKALGMTQSELKRIGLEVGKTFTARCANEEAQFEEFKKNSEYDYIIENNTLTAEEFRGMLDYFMRTCKYI